MAEVQEWFKTHSRGWTPEELERVLGEARKLEVVGFDTRLLNKTFTGDIQPLNAEVCKKMVNEDEQNVDKAELMKHAPGGFFTNALEMAEIGIQGIYVQSDEIEHALIHEFAHWLTDSWIKRLLPVAVGDLDQSLLDVEKLDAGFSATMKEYKAISSSTIRKGFDDLLGYVKAKGVKSFEDFKKLMLNEDETEFAVPVPSMAIPPGYTAYSLSDPREWIADTFKHYFKDMEAHLSLRETAPCTYEFLSNFVQGKYFKQEGA